MPAGDAPAPPGALTPGIEQTETLVRQIKEGGGNPLFFDSSRAPKPVLDRSVFLPSRADTDGLSLIRVRYRSETWAAFRAETPDQRHRLARLAPSVLLDCARHAGLEWLTFEPSPDDLDREHGEPWAHCVAKEINRVAYDDKTDPDAKKRIFTWAESVSKSLMLADVTAVYPRPVTGRDNYRPEPA